MGGQGHGARGIVAAAVIAVLAAAPAGRAQQPATAGLVDEVDAWIAEQRRALGIPGMAAAVVVEGEVALATGHGVTQADDGRRVSGDTPFVIASVGKGVTALAVGRLVDQGLLGMSSSSADVDAATEADVATGHYHTMFLGHRPRSTETPTGTAASFAMVSSAADLARVLQVHLGDGVVDGDRFVSADTLARLHQGRPTEPGSPVAYAGGLLVQPPGQPGMADELSATSVLWHGGSSVAYRSELRLLPELGLGVVVLANANDVVDESLLGQVAWGSVLQLVGLDAEPVGPGSPWLVRWSKQLLAGLLVLQVAAALGAVATLRRLAARRRLRPLRDGGLLVASTLLDVVAAVLLLVVVPSEGGVPTTFLLQLVDYRILLGGIALGVCWGIVRTIVVTVALASRRRVGTTSGAAA